MDDHGPLDETHLPENCDECKRVVAINKMERESALRGLRGLMKRQADDEALQRIGMSSNASEAYTRHALRTLQDAVAKYLAFVEPL